MKIKPNTSSKTTKIKSLISKGWSDEQIKFTLAGTVYATSSDYIKIIRNEYKRENS
jgi:hypothetical protein